MHRNIGCEQEPTTRWSPGDRDYLSLLRPGDTPDPGLAAFLRAVEHVLNDLALCEPVIEAFDRDRRETSKQAALTGGKRARAR